MLPVAVYYGASKPDDVHEFMSDFIVELDLISQNGFCLNEARFTFTVSAFIMDAQAKSYIMDIKVGV